MSIKSQIERITNEVTTQTDLISQIASSLNTKIGQLQEKTVTPIKQKQVITCDEDYAALSKVTVEAIPSNFTDTSDADAQAKHILDGYTAYSSGVKLDGTMANNGDQVITIHQGNIDDESIIIKEGYHAGEGYAEVVSTFMSVTPTENTQTIVPSVNDNGEIPFLSKVFVQPIPTYKVTIYNEIDVTIEVHYDDTYIELDAGTVVTITMTSKSFGIYCPDKAFFPNAPDCDATYMTNESGNEGIAILNNPTTTQYSVRIEEN